MSKYNGCQLSSATLLARLFVVNYGQFGPNLTNKSDGINKAIKMTLDGNFVVIELLGKAGQKHIELVPVTFFSQLTPVIEAQAPSTETK